MKLVEPFSDLNFDIYFGRCPSVCESFCLVENALHAGIGKSSTF